MIGKLIMSLGVIQSFVAVLNRSQVISVLTPNQDIGLLLGAILTTAFGMGIHMVTAKYQ